MWRKGLLNFSIFELSVKIRGFSDNCLKNPFFSFLSIFVFVREIVLLLLKLKKRRLFWWGSWSYWTACSVTCGSGKQNCCKKILFFSLFLIGTRSRKRKCYSFLGSKCSGSNTEKQKCDRPACRMSIFNFVFFG